MSSMFCVNLEDLMILMTSYNIVINLIVDFSLQNTYKKQNEYYQ